MMINVLFVGMTPNPGGLETYMINIFSKLQGNGFQFFFVNTYNKPIAYSKFIKQNQGIIYNIPMKRNMTRYLIRYHVVKHFFKYHHNFDIVHINALAVNEYYWANAAEKYGENHIIFQSHESNTVKEKGLLPFLQKIWSIHNKHCLNNDNYITKLAASNGCGRWMFNNPKSFKVIYNGVDSEYFKPNLHERIYLRRKLNLSQDKVVITTARIHVQKNYPKIIHVFKCINEINSNTKLVIIGSGPDASYIKQMVKDLNLNNSVLFLGVQNKQHISKLLNVADLMLMPSFYEAVPFSLTEAQSVGVPALVSLKRVPKEANITGNVYYLSLSKSNKSWAREALNILDVPFNLKNRFKMNKKVGQSKYSVNRAVNDIKCIYKVIINNY